MPDPDPTPDPTPDPAPDPKPDPAPDPTPDPPKDDLGPAGQAALAAERLRAKNAEKEAKDLQKRLDAIEAEKLSDTEKLQRKAEAGERLAAEATSKLRKANLIGALAEKGLIGAKGKAAARLLDDVEYGDDDEPTNLDTVIDAAKAEYGDEQFKATPHRPTPPSTDGPAGKDDTPPPDLTAEELDAAKATGKTPEQWAALKTVHNIDDWTRLKQAEKAAKT